MLNLAWKELWREAVTSDDLETSKSVRAIEAKERELEYKMELEKMLMRVQQQPTLFQRQTRVIRSIIHCATVLDFHVFASFLLCLHWL